VGQSVTGERQLVEAAAAGLSSDVAVHRFDTVLFEDHAVVDRLAHGLYAERFAGIPDGKALSVDGAHRDAELLRIDPLELRDVVGHVAAVVRPHPVVHVLKLDLEGEEFG
jgi:hypothetical protein